MQPKTERFEMRLDPRTFEKVDEWRARQADLPSRAEAVRRLVEMGMDKSYEERLEFSDGERLIVHMLCELYRHLEIDGGVDADFVEAALHGGHDWALRWQYSGIFHGHEDSKRVLDEVLQVLDMWDAIVTSYEKLNKKDKERVAKEAEPFGKDLHFPGFGGNEESAYLSIASFLINRMERFTALKRRDLNSHFPTRDMYRRMYKMYEPKRTRIGGILSATEIIDLLQEMVHPDNRKK